MLPEESSYRPHDPGHDYYEPGIYLITLVVRDRIKQPELLGSLNDDLKQPGVILTSIGKAVEEEWEKTQGIQASKGNDITILNQSVMPDHWHGVIRINKRMEVSLGYIIQLFKAACTGRWRKINAFSESPSTAAQIRHMSAWKRQAYYAQRPREEQPLWDDNYDDTICIDAEHLRRMMHYVDDNPRRAIIRRLRPHYMQRCLHVVIDGRDYAAFGNMFLLRWARKVQVFCHRRARFGQLTDKDKQTFHITYEAIPDFETSIPYEQTDAYEQEKAAWIAQIMAGQTVIVTPGISKGEQDMKDECLDRGYPLILLQKEPIGRYWKPEDRRFEACARGRLLILAPLETLPLARLCRFHSDIGERTPSPEVGTEYQIFHNLNKLAEEICAFEGKARIIP